MIILAAWTVGLGRFVGVGSYICGHGRLSNHNRGLYARTNIGNNRLITPLPKVSAIISLILLAPEITQVL